ncbi:hypothetical protein GUITHDRAFT_155525 [Guillardia theta CCMP2712]|uniref:DUF7733 domain-containing protein n=1 Tax=Guillardia theta (strain CCMP2712) TaxID=905079 RepID=L1IH19_GUITC|nr:hypothetical protein GUITHDRAFT_155525 [Guillardia theta CCMP2712]EKX35367.1 hypothetical protein GUITHDRAFT_155525 [Guillardia theta CCMP2712]|eukprot:XP_005822347.1 hypothetical protein GUITHDRAFT_155525 [Guillardia theta CCMP2712]
MAASLGFASSSLAPLYTHFPPLRSSPLTPPTSLPLPCHPPFSSRRACRAQPVRRGTAQEPGKDVEKRASSQALKSVQRARRAAQGLLVAIYVGSMLSLDYVFTAIKPQNFVFVVFWFGFSWLLNAKVYKQEEAVKPLLPERWVSTYAKFMAVISIPLPWLLIFQGNKDHVMAAGSHLYLIMAQVLMETLMVKLKWSTAVRLLTPIAYNTYRLLSLRDWYMAVFFSEYLEDSFGLPDKLVALTNLVMWTFNLFYVLLIKTLPLHLNPNYLKPSQGASRFACRNLVRLIKLK